MALLSPVRLRQFEMFARCIGPMRLIQEGRWKETFERMCDMEPLLSIAETDGVKHEEKEEDYCEEKEMEEHTTYPEIHCGFKVRNAAAKAKVLEFLETLAVQEYVPEMFLPTARPPGNDTHAIKSLVESLRECHDWIERQTNPQDKREMITKLFAILVENRDVMERNPDVFSRYIRTCLTKALYLVRKNGVIAAFAFIASFRPDLVSAEVHPLVSIRPSHVDTDILIVMQHKCLADVFRPIIQSGLFSKMCVFI